MGNVVARLDDFHYFSKDKAPRRLYNWVVTVVDDSDSNIVLNPREHTAWMWATAKDVEGLNLTSKKRLLLRDVFAYIESTKQVEGDPKGAGDAAE